MKKYFLFILLFFIPLIGFSQNDYRNAAGVRAGISSGLTYKHAFKNNKSTELMLTTRWGSLVFTGLYEINQDVFMFERLNFYYGLGGHAGLWNGEKDREWFSPDHTEGMVGLDGIIGLGYTFEQIPFEISIDWKPSFNIVAYTDFWVDEVAFSLRYIIN